LFCSYHFYLNHLQSIFMEKKNQLVIGLLLLALGIGGFTAFQKGLFGGNAVATSGANLAAAASMPSTAPDAVPGAAQSGNIPGTNTNAEIVPAGPSTTIKFEEESFNFGTVKEGDVVKHVFKFKNTGTEPLVISNAKGSCGCTVPTWPKEAIAPGATGEIKVEFNTAGKPGQQTKRVTVTGNTVPTDNFIDVTGQVTPKG
jgi:Protein of unknown function (DUF1573)